MIIDKLANIDLYRGISKNLDTAIAFLKTADFSDTKAGRYDVDGDNVYYMLQTPALRAPADACWEIHAKYIDIQLALQGGEAIGWTNAARVSGWGEYIEENDITLAPMAGQPGDALTLNANDFIILFPDDAHAPLLFAGDAVNTRKVVVKVRI